MNEPSPQLVDLSLRAPEENLALDEALLIESEAALAAGEDAARNEWLRLWESARHFVVLGVSGRLREEVHVDRCRRLGIPILRRASGGGSVLQGPGCLNFTLILSLRDRPALRDLHASYRSILARTASRLAPEAAVYGTSDLAIPRGASSGDAGKFSGNAQKRTRHALLHHGTILYNLDIDLVEQVLKVPPKQPDYRRDRSHAAFCTNLALPAGDLKEAIALAWNARPGELAPPDLTTLVEEKYGNPDWTERF
jgi:lipoate-protein ligase A